MSEARNPPSARSNARQGAGPARATPWRDIQWMEFEAAEPAAAPEQAAAPHDLPAAADLDEPVDNPEIPQNPAPVAAPAADERSEPIYGRALAPLPRYLIGSVPAPPRPGGATEPVKRTPPTSGLGVRAVLQGTPFPTRDPVPARSRGWIIAVLLGAAAAAIGSHADQILAAFGEATQRPASAMSARPAIRSEAPPRKPDAAAAPASAPPAVAPQSAQALLGQAEAGDPQAEYALAVLYARGQGVTQDYAAAASWFREAAIAGNVPAQYNLGVMYERGLGLGKNMNEALIWYHSAAAKDYPAAEYNLALSYADGRGGPQDYVSAARWYLRAARQGVVAAMINFAILCENGEGTARSPVTAYAWYKAAAARGDNVAAQRADELAAQFSAGDRRLADAAAAQVAASVRAPAPSEDPLSPTPPRKSAIGARAPGHSAG